MDSSDKQAPMVRSGRFAALSHVSEDERVVVQSGGVSRGFKRLRRVRDKRVSQATTVQADMADVVRCDSDFEAESAQHEQNV